MDVGNDTPDQIKHQLKQLDCMRAAYCIVKIVIIALVMVTEFGPELASSGDKFDELVDSKQFALINFSINIGSTILAVFVFIYLICMGLQM